MEIKEIKKKLIVGSDSEYADWDLLEQLNFDSLTFEF